MPNLYLAAAYATAQRLTGLRAAREPGVFTYVLTVLSAGLAFVVAAVAVHRTSRMAGLAGRHALALTASFATASLALVYARQVNHHIMLLAIACLLTLALLSFARAADHGPRAGAAAWAGTLGGIGYTIDLGVGPILWLTTGLFVAAHARSLRPAALYALSSVPWLALHHAVNYAIAGSFLPANMIPAYFAYPGSPFSRANMTGFLQHEGVTGAAVYALEMLWGKKGFVLHNLPLLALVALPSAWRHWSRHERAIAWWAIVWIGLAWLLYAAASNNMGGGSISIRWFVPFLGPLWLFLALSLRDGHMSWNGFQVLAAFGIVLSVLGWWVGPWSLRMVPGYWFVVGSAVLAWAYQRRREARRSA